MVPHRLWKQSPPAKLLETRNTPLGRVDLIASDVIPIWSRNPRVKLAPLMYGGGQERDLRPGTPNVPAIAAFGEACRLAGAERETENSRLTELRDRLWQTLRAGLADVQLNGDPVLHLAGNLDLSFGGVPSGSWILTTWPLACVPRSVRPDPCAATRTANASVTACSSANCTVGLSPCRCQPKKARPS